MIVTEETVNQIVNHLSSPGSYACDTETTGLSLFKGDRLFSIVISDAEEDYYFNFLPYPNGPKGHWLKEEHKAALRKLFSLPEHRWWFVNAKFDLHALSMEGIEVAGDVACVSAAGRLIRNDLFAYGMDALAKRWLHREKSDMVKKWCLENNAYRTFQVPGKKEKVKQPFYYKAPLDKIHEYGCDDGRITYDLGRFVADAMQTLDKESEEKGYKPVSRVWENERRLTKTLYRMEKVGVRLDRRYAEEAMKKEKAKKKEAESEFKRATGVDFEDKPTVLTKVFEEAGLNVVKSEKGYPLFNKEVLSQIDHPLVKPILDWRASDKKVGTYFLNFLQKASYNGRIHADFKQFGAKTGRLSCVNPNMQNLSKESVEDDSLTGEDKSYIRRCFVPTDGYYFAFIDYDQIEYRMMIDAAARAKLFEQDLIDKVLSGWDVHTATAEMMDVDRQKAKTINFMQIFGGGVTKLARMLGLTYDEAKKLRDLYFSRLPKITTFINAVRKAAEERKFLRNWYGRRYVFPRADRVYTTAPNWLIQGGTADVLKIALNRLDDYLSDKKSRLVLNIHDEVVLEIHYTEDYVVPECKRIMEGVYPYVVIPFTAGIEWSDRSMADKRKWNAA